MAKCSHFTKRWIKTKGILVIVLIVYIAQFVILHIPKNNALIPSAIVKLNISLGKAFVAADTRSVALSTFAHLSTYQGKQVEYTCYTQNYSRTRVWKLKYENFNLSAPLFSSDTSRKFFFKNTDNRDFIGARPREHLKGELYLVRNGTYAMNFNCGYKGNPAHVLVNRSISKANWYHKVAAFYSPEAWTFQHFLDGALPKIIQALHLLRDPDITILFERPPRDKIITEILDKLNISRNRVAAKRVPQIGADYFYFTCITPPIHPVLWQSARRMIGVPETLETPLDSAFVVFVTRKGCVNCGRVVRNENDVISMLAKRYGESRVRLFRGGLSLKGVTKLFGNARIVMGSHGGGMYNINFAPINTTVIEFMPTLPDGSMIAASKKIIWSQSQLLGQIYWRMCLAPVPGSKGDIVVDLRELEDILNATDKQALV